KARGFKTVEEMREADERALSEPPALDHPTRQKPSGEDPGAGGQSDGDGVEPQSKTDAPNWPPAHAGGSDLSQTLQTCDVPLSYQLPPSSDGGKGLNNNSSASAKPSLQPYSAKAEEVVGASNLPLKREATDTTSTPSETSQTSQTDWTDVLGRKLGEA